MPISADEIIEAVDRLKPTPSNVTQILREVDKPGVNIEQIAEMIGLDQVLAALVLQVSNSASLGYARTCSTLREAIMHIGLLRLKSILLTSSAISMMKIGLGGYRFGPGELWQHSLSVGLVAEWLAGQLNYPEPEQAYVAGLLHDIGKLLMDQAISCNYPTIINYVSKYKKPLWLVEEKVIGIDHARIGGLIAEHWNFPVILVDAIRFHHVPSFARINQRLPAIVNLANSFTEDYQLKNSALLSFTVHPESWHILKINPNEVDKIKIRLRNSGALPNIPIAS